MAIEPPIPSDNYYGWPASAFVPIPLGTPSYPPNQAEADALAAINDPAFSSAWNSTKYGLSFSWQGDSATITSLYPLCVAYAKALPPKTP